MLGLEVRLPSYLLSKGPYIWAVRIYNQKFLYINHLRLTWLMFYLIFLSKVKTIIFATIYSCGKF